MWHVRGRARERAKGSFPFSLSRGARKSAPGVLPWLRRSRLDIDKWPGRGVRAREREKEGAGPASTQRHFYICRDTHLSARARLVGGKRVYEGGRKRANSKIFRKRVKRDKLNTWESGRQGIGKRVREEESDERIVG